jgi:hypothetical protein
MSFFFTRGQIKRLHFIGEMITKYVCDLDLDNLLEPEQYIMMKNMKMLCKTMVKMRKDNLGLDIEYVLFT